MQKIIPKSDLPSFINNLAKSYRLVAPTSKTPTSFQEVSSYEQITLATPTSIPVKSHFMPENETLLEFKNGKITEITSGEICNFSDKQSTSSEANKQQEKKATKPSILFGLRKCDLNAIQILDKTMYDPQYLAKRKQTILIGVFCDSPDQYCFCNSMKLENFHDIFIFPKGKNLILDVKTKAGEELTKDLPTLEKELPIPNPKNKKKLKNLEITKNYKDSIWESEAEKCLSCSACTINCPTCNCFDIKDTLNTDLKSGVRTRSSSSCQLKSFSKVAGGKSYRDSRVSRFKHFVYHKISYFNIQHGRPMCVGCGRCLRVCPTKIDWVKTINKLPKNSK